MGVTASCKGHAAVVDCLLEHHTTSVNMSVSGGWTALMWATWYGHTEVVQTLLTAPGVQKDKLNHAGKNAVMYAAEAGRPRSAGYFWRELSTTTKLMRKTEPPGRTDLINYWTRLARLAVTCPSPRWF